MVLWYLSTSETNRQLASRFGTTEPVIHESVVLALGLIVNRLADQVMFPVSESECSRIANKFQQKNGFPGIIGAINGTHVNIMKPKTEPDAWIDRKEHHSISVTAAVDSEKRFIYYFVGCPGSLHDQHVFRLSDIIEKLKKVPEKYHLVGDSSYARSSELIVPYSGNNLTAEQRSFNFLHSSNRMVVEHAFGLLKNKFARVHNTLNVRIWDIAALSIRVAIILHNFKINNQSEKVQPQPELHEVVFPQDGFGKRNAMARILLEL